MRKRHIFAVLAVFVLFVACCVFAGDKGLDVAIMSVTPTATNQTITATNTTIRGYLESITIDVTSAAITSTCAVAYDYGTPSTLADVNLLVSTNIADEFTTRLRLVSQNADGADLASVEGNRFCLVGGVLKFTVSETITAGTGVTHRALIKYWKN